MSDEQIDDTVVEDKTSPNEEDPFADLPDEDEPLEKKEPEKVDRSEVAQKIKYREKFQTAQARIDELEKQIQSSQKKGTPDADNEKELAAQRYIRNQALEAIKDYEQQKKADEDKALKKFQDQLDEVLEDNPDFTEQQLLDICEEFEVEPKIAIKILKKTSEQKTKKPSLPSSRRGSPEGVTVEKAVDDSGKSLYHIAQEVKNALRIKK